MRWAAVALLALPGCDDYLFGEIGAGETEVPEVEGFAGVREIVDARCLGCHSATSMLGGLDLETDLHASTVGVIGSYGLPVVLAGSPDDSILFLKITDTHPDNTGTDMPPGSGGLPLVLTDIVQDWILDGAPAE